MTTLGRSRKGLSFVRGRRSFLRSCLCTCAGLCLPLGGMAHAFRPHYSYLAGRVLTCAGPGFGVLPEYEDGAVLLRGGRILEVGPRAALTVPHGAAVLDLGSATILPGIIDAHVHEAAPASLRRSLLLQGVTAVGDVGSPPGDLRELGRMRDQNGEPVARGFGTGPMFGPPDGYPGRVWPARLGLAVATAGQARTEAMGLLDLMEDASAPAMLKIAFEPGPNPDSPWPVLGLDAARAVVRAAHERGAVVRCHVQELSCLSLALRAGVDTVEHTVVHMGGHSGLRHTGEPVFRGERGALEPGAEYSRRLRELAQAGVMLVPTLEMGVRAAWDGSGALSAVRAFRSWGGQVALGTDAPMRGVRHGMPLGELRLLRRAGLSRAETLRAATAGSACALGREAMLGVIAPGMCADLIAVQGDPCAHLAALEDVVMVIQDGEVVRLEISSA